MVSGAVMEVGQNALKIVCSIKKDIVIVLNLLLEEMFAQERIKSLNTVLKEIANVRCMISFDISSFSLSTGCIMHCAIFQGCACS